MIIVKDANNKQLCKVKRKVLSSIIPLDFFFMKLHEHTYIFRLLAYAFFLHGIMTLHIIL